MQTSVLARRASTAACGRQTNVPDRQLGPRCCQIDKNYRNAHSLSHCHRLQKGGESAAVAGMRDSRTGIVAKKRLHDTDGKYHVAYTIVSTPFLSTTRSTRVSPSFVTYECYSPPTSKVCCWGRSKREGARRRPATQVTGNAATQMVVLAPDGDVIKRMLQVWVAPIFSEEAPDLTPKLRFD